MKILNPFNRQKHSNQYLLEIVDTPVKKSVPKTRLKGGFKGGRKLVSTLIVSTLLVVGVGAGATAATMNTTANTTAQAGLVDDFMNGIFSCITKDNVEIPFGGSNAAVKDGISDSERKSPHNSGGINVSFNGLVNQDSLIKDDGTPVAGAKWTALEQYGYYAPSYTSWKPALAQEDKMTFSGTNGKAKNGLEGLAVKIEKPLSTKMYTAGGIDCLAPGPSTATTIGNMGLGTAAFLVAVGGELYNVAVGMDVTNKNSPISSLTEAVITIISGTPGNPDSGLTKILFLDWLLVIIIVGTLGLIWQGLVKRSSMQAAQGAVWMILASITGILLLANPLAVPKTIDTVVGGFTNAAVTTLLPPGSDNTLCALPTSKDMDTISANSSRQVKCAIWEATIYNSWVSGQFNINAAQLKAGTAKGDSVAGNMKNDNPEEPKSTVTKADKLPDGKGWETVSGDSMSFGSSETTRPIFNNANIKFGDTTVDKKNVNWALYQLDRQAGASTGTVNKGEDVSEVAYNQLVLNKNDAWGDGSAAIGAGGMALIAAAGPAAILIVLSATMIGYQLAMLILIAFSPIFFLLGVAPGWGRRITMRWFELVVGLLLKRVVLTIFLLLYVKIYTVLIQTASIPFWIQAIIAIALTITVFTQRDKITGIFNNAIDFGGTKGVDAGGAIGHKLETQAKNAPTNAFRAARRKHANNKLEAQRNNVRRDSTGTTPGGKATTITAPEETLSTHSKQNTPTGDKKTKPAVLTKGKELFDNSAVGQTTNRVADKIGDKAHGLKERASEQVARVKDWSAGIRDKDANQIKRMKPSDIRKGALTDEELAQVMDPVTGKPNRRKLNELVKDKKANAIDTHNIIQEDRKKNENDMRQARDKMRDPATRDEGKTEMVKAQNERKKLREFSTEFNEENKNLFNPKTARARQSKIDTLVPADKKEAERRASEFKALQEKAKTKAQLAQRKTESDVRRKTESDVRRSDQRERRDVRRSK